MASEELIKLLRPRSPVNWGVGWIVAVSTRGPWTLYLTTACSILHPCLGCTRTHVRCTRIPVSVMSRPDTRRALYPA
ncbi:hypothetical protein ACOMHN_038120 [Nucella lapillus]